MTAAAWAADVSLPEGFDWQAFSLLCSKRLGEAKRELASSRRSPHAAGAGQALRHEVAIMEEAIAQCLGRV